MHKNTFAYKLLTLPSFQAKYRPLLVDSVSTQFPLCRQQSAIQVDLTYLLKCASLLAQGDLPDCQEVALRIAHYTLTSGTASQYEKAAALLIMDTLTNYSAIRLAESKQLTDSDVLSRVPLPLNLDVLKRRMDHSIWDEPQEAMLLINKFQKRVLEATAVHAAVSISAPTSSGKSFVLMRVLLEELACREPQRVLVYIVPTRALIQQVLDDVTKLVVGNTTGRILVSPVPIPYEDEDYDAVVYVLTQERLQWLLSDEQQLHVDVLFVDEAQKVGEGTRGILLQQVIEESCRRNPNTKVFFASPMSSNPEFLLGITPESVSKTTVKSDLVTVNQNLLWINCTKSREMLWNMRLCTGDDFVELGTFRTRFRPDRVVKRMPFVAHALTSADGGCMIYANGAAEAETMAGLLYDLEDSAERVSDERTEDLVSLVKKTIHKEYSLATVLKRGVAYHYGNMPLLIKNEIESLFKAGVIKFLVCTSTLLEGVNLPAKTIFMRAPSKGLGNPMNAIDFWNLAGRAGRQGREFQGNIVCVDTDDGKAWKDRLFVNRSKYPIRSSINDIINKEHEDLAAYIRQDIAGTLNNRIPKYEYAMTYLVNERSKGQFPHLERLLMANQYMELSDVLNDLAEAITLPCDLTARHQGISPIAQQKLMDYFAGFHGDLAELVPALPEDSDAQRSYAQIIRLVHQYLGGKKVKSGLEYYLAKLVVWWMRGYGLAQIIDSNLEYNSHRREKPKSTAAVIRQTMRDIEEYVRFEFVKYSACYSDILRYYLTQNRFDSLASQVPRLNIWLELGASQTTQVSLMNLGLSRTSAIALSEHIASDSLTVKECIKWLDENEVSRLDLSIIVADEIRRVHEKAKVMSQ